MKIEITNLKLLLKITVSSKELSEGMLCGNLIGILFENSSHHLKFGDLSNTEALIYFGHCDSKIHPSLHFWVSGFFIEYVCLMSELAAVVVQSGAVLRGFQKAGVRSPLVERITHHLCICRSKRIFNPYINKCWIR